jgi:hypothetical protein
MKSHAEQQTSSTDGKRSFPREHLPDKGSTAGSSMLMHVGFLSTLSTAHVKGLFKEETFKH